MILLIELCLALLAIPMAFALPRAGDRWSRAVERPISRFAARRLLAVLAIFLLVLGLRLALLPIEPIPTPGVHDEFSYLLMGDTFAHGRLTNPTHPMWTHFETMHVNQKPTYGSMYYPGQGVFLALGQVMFGHPFWGVWLSTGLMCAALCWALQGWMPAGWAFLGGILAILRFGVFSYWANSFWGGSVAALGGALVLGALPRMCRRQRVSDAIVMGVGLSILGNTRPYESIFYCAPILGVLANSFYKRRAELAQRFRTSILPAAIVVLITIFAMGYYFWRCTGSPLRTPYMVNVDTYQLAPIFPWKTVKHVPKYEDANMRNFYFGCDLPQYLDYRYHPINTIIVRAAYAWIFFLGPLLLAPLLSAAAALPWGITLRQLGRKTSLLLIVCIVSIAALLLPTYFEFHYAAPMWAALLALEMQAVRRTWTWNRDRNRHGAFFVRLIVASCILIFVLRIFTLHTSLGRPLSLEAGLDLSERARMVENFNHSGGQHLVFVRYSAGHNPNVEWVYNGADIDSQQVVWARDMGQDRNQELLDYYKNRRAWLVMPDADPPVPIPYTDSPVNGKKNYSMPGNR